MAFERSLLRKVIVFPSVEENDDFPFLSKRNNEILKVDESVLLLTVV